MGDKYRLDPVMEGELSLVVKDITGSAEVMWDMQDAFVSDTASVKPKNKDFAVLSFVSGPTGRGGIEYIASEETAGLFDVAMAFNFTISVNIYTNNAHLLKALKLSQLLRIESYRKRLKAVGLSFLGEGAVSDFSEFDETRYNLRSHIDLFFSYISIEKDVNIGSIEFFEANGSLGDNASRVRVHKTKGIL